LLEDALEDLRPLLPDTPLPSTESPGRSFEAARDAARSALDRTTAAGSEHQRALARINSLMGDARAEELRIGEMDRQIDDLTQDLDGLIRALTDLVPYVGSDVCPVCGRDFGEVSEVGLIAHVSENLSQYTQQLERVRSLNLTRSAASRALESMRREITDLEARRLSDDDYGQLLERSEKLALHLEALEALGDQVAVGERLLVERREADAAVAAAERDAWVGTSRGHRWGLSWPPAGTSDGHQRGLSRGHGQSERQS